MKARCRAALIGLCLLAADVEAPAVVSASNVREALTGGTYGVKLRYRFEAVSDDTPSLKKDSYASTLRTTLFYRSGLYAGAGVFLEVEDVSALGLQDEFDNRGAGPLANHGAGRPVIADVEHTEFNQAYLAFDRIQKTRITIGRFELALGDERFVGPVGWRQNHQSFDGVTVVQESIPRTKLTYGYLRDVHRIFGDHQRMQGHVFHLQIDGSRAGKLAPFIDLLDYAQRRDAGQSRLTYGVDWTGRVTLSTRVDLPYRLQLATQRDAGDNPADVSAGYARAEVGAQLQKVAATLGAEILEGNPTDGAFSTPLATLHKFNGWADKFLSTPATGLQDFFAAVNVKQSSWAAVLVFHDFRANSVDATYGTEFDAQLTYQTSWNQVVAAKLAVYSADEYSSDTVKTMLWMTYGF